MFGQVRMLHMQPNGKVWEESLYQNEIEAYLGEDPIQHIHIAGGLYLFYSWKSRIPRSKAERTTVLYDAVSRECVRIYGRTLIGRLDAEGYASVRGMDIEIARRFVRVYARGGAINVNQ